MPNPNEHSCRLQNPDKFDKMKRVNGDRKHEGKPYDVIYGHKQDTDTWEDQAFRYKTKSWSEGEARSHCSDHDGEFHPAGESSAGICPDKVNKSLVNLYQDIQAQPMFMEATGLGVMKSAIRCALEKFGGRPVNSELLNFIFLFDEDDEDDGDLEIDEGVAIIPIKRSLTNLPADHFLVRYGVYQSYEKIRDLFLQAQNNANVQAIMYRVDSPGGVHAGLMDLLDELYQNRGKKPTIAVVEEDMFSAAYGIGSTADEIWINRSSAVGSIGTLLVHEEESEWLKKAGFTVTDFTYGRKKAQFAFWKPLSEEAKADLQAVVDAAGKEFTEAVARNLGTQFGTIKALEAGVYEGQQAVKIGLANRIIPFRDALAEIKSLYVK